MNKPNDNMSLPKGCKIIVEINNAMRYGTAKLLARQFRSELRKTTIDDFHISIETESPEYNGPINIVEQWERNEMNFTQAMNEVRRKMGFILPTKEDIEWKTKRIIEENREVFDALA